jgi:hypothetical protein
MNFSLLALALSLALLPLTIGGEAAAAQFVGPSPVAAGPLVTHAKYECGTFDGHFTCRSVPGEAGPGGKGAIPRITTPPSSEEPPAVVPGEPGTTAPAAGRPGGTGCPESSELLGGYCVHYIARCNVAPQPCPGPEEKLVCKLGPDGQRTCCCLTYDK